MKKQILSTNQNVGTNAAIIGGNAGDGRTGNDKLRYDYALDGLPPEGRIEVG